MNADERGCRTPRYRAIARTVLVLTVLVIVAVAYVDFLGFTAEGKNLQTVVSDLGGRSGSIGGWPMGQEHHIVFDRPLTDDKMARLAEAMAQCRRRYFSISLRGWDISDVRLDEIRETLFSQSKGWVRPVQRDPAEASLSASAPESGSP